MRWIQPRSNRIQPAIGSYSEWKQEIASDCGSQCVYCAIAESSYGGLDNFHVEHYKPKSLFAALINTIANLYLACAICNRFKGDDWPCEPDQGLSCASYPDPAIHDYNLLFKLDGSCFVIEGVNAASKYLVEKLYLNRPQLILERRMVAAEERADQFCNWLDTCADRLGTQDAAVVAATVELLKLTAELNSLGRAVRQARPYNLTEVRRAK